MLLQHCTATAVLGVDVERVGLSIIGRQFFAESRSQESPEKHKCVSEAGDSPSRRAQCLRAAPLIRHDTTRHLPYCRSREDRIQNGGTEAHETQMDMCRGGQRE